MAGQPRRIDEVKVQRQTLPQKIRWRSCKANTQSQPLASTRVITYVHTHPSNVLYRPTPTHTDTVLTPRGCLTGGDIPVTL